MAKTGVETDVSQQFRKTGVETGQQLFSLSVNQVCLNSVSTLSRSPCFEASGGARPSRRAWRALGVLGPSARPAPSHGAAPAACIARQLVIR